MEGQIWMKIATLCLEKDEKHIQFGWFEEKVLKFVLAKHLDGRDCASSIPDNTLKDT